MMRHATGTTLIVVLMLAAACTGGERQAGSGSAPQAPVTGEQPPPALPTAPTPPEPTRPIDEPAGLLRLLNTLPAGTPVFANGRLLGETPLAAQPLPETATVVLAPPGHYPVRWVHPGDRPVGSVILVPLDRPPGVWSSADTDRIAGGMVQEQKRVYWELGPLPTDMQWEWLPSPSGRWIALVGHGAGYDTLLRINPNGAGPQVLAVEATYSVRSPDGHPADELLIRLVGWRDDDRLVVLRPAPRVEGGELVLALEEYGTGVGPARLLGWLPVSAAVGDISNIWLTREAAYLVKAEPSFDAGELWRAGLDGSAGQLLRDDLLVAPDCGCVGTALAPDGERLIHGMASSWVGLVNVTTGRDFPWVPPAVNVDSIRWSPDGRLLAQLVTGEPYGGVWLDSGGWGFPLSGAVRVVGRDGDERATLRLPDGRFLSDAWWTPDGRHLLAVAAQSADPESQAETALVYTGLFLLGLDGRVARIAPVPDNWWPRLVGDGWVIGAGSGGRGLTVTSWSGSVPPLPPGGEDTVLLPDGRVAVWDSAGTLWACRPGDPACMELHRIQGLPGPAPRVAGRWLLTETHRGDGVYITGVPWLGITVARAMDAVLESAEVHEFRSRVTAPVIAVFTGETDSAYEISVGENLSDHVAMALHFEVNWSDGSITSFDPLTGAPVTR